MLIERLWAAGEMPFRDGLYRAADDTALTLYVDGPGAYHPEAGQPIPFRLGGPIDVRHAIEEDGTTEVDPFFETPLPRLPDGPGWLCGGGSGMGNIGYIARLEADRSLRWVAVMFQSNPFVGVRHEGGATVLTNDWGNRLTLDLAALDVSSSGERRGGSRPVTPPPV